MKIIERHGEILGQLIRFGLTGGLLTVLVAGGYWLVATLLHVEPMLSLTLNFILFTGLGYLLHSRFSFRGHGARDRAAARTARFFTVNLIGFLSNQFFVWLLVKQLNGPTWWPVLPILFVTPLITFALNRRWVFA
ncbi:GtrA family protein [Sphingosinicella sp. CPCC 101087]|jgi:putative flippase GtrA|uniref:GtrA family protein n=1 Tax=Sphingosinicella sp. CPCC 101087 TaxID=2497754 RepID=UPI00101DFD67|nr:GtrA family protein [Sphingosinicella sp. CPCC 101087]